MSLRTFILAELYDGRFTFGLELARRFEAARILSWEGVNHTSVYRALARLCEAGFVARYREGTSARATARLSAARRNRKFYAITREGRRHFEALLSGELSEPRTYRNPLNIAVHCVRSLPKARAVALLESRRDRLAALEAQAGRVARAAQAAGRGSPRNAPDPEAAYGRLAAERILMKTRAELFFAGSLADLVRGAG